jgi:peptide/nickel transport system ATP-binding protein
MLKINNLTIDFQTENGLVRAVDSLSLRIARGETLGIVGESGSGKSVTALSVMRLLQAPPARITSGEIWFKSEKISNNSDQAVNLLELPETQVREYRGSKIAMIFQEPMTSLNPVFRCGYQVTEAIRLHQSLQAEEARKQVIRLFEQVRLPDAGRIFNAFPHQISGGQKQRVMIAMAMSCQPELLIADEPTTALDVTVQKAILGLLRDIRTEKKLSMLFISHDLGVISEICDRVAVMYKGKIVEEGPVDMILQHPRHPYTRGLIACRPSLHQKLRRLPTVPDFLEDKNHTARVVTVSETDARKSALYAQQPLLQIEKLIVRYPAKKNWFGQPVEWINAVDDLNFDVFPGETFGLAGESGCGKTTLGRSVARLVEAQSGAIRYKGVELRQLSPEAFRPYRREIQVVFQDPYSSLNPRMTAGQAIVEPMEVHKLHPNDRTRKEKAIDLLETVGLRVEHFHRYPHEFSGGQRQRVCIARALALEPRFLICDEIVSSLDVSVQATVLNLLTDLQERFGLTYLFISHDLSVIKQMCDRMAVMHHGRFEALGFPDEIFRQPPNAYVRQLIDAIPGQ